MVGDLAIDGLKKLDQIAYIRFAIVYLKIDDLRQSATKSTVYWKIKGNP